jgi:hypothetical protein
MGGEWGCSGHEGEKKKKKNKNILRVVRGGGVIPNIPAKATLPGGLCSMGKIFVILFLGGMQQLSCGPIAT